MKIGLLKEGKIPADKRVPFSPDQCAYIMDLYHNVSIYIQPSSNRCFSDFEYKKNGVFVKKDLSECDIIMGIKEVPIDMLIDNKMFLFFSHTIKKQPYNQLLLKKIIEKNIQLVDYETLTDQNYKRLIGFGRYAGIVGCYNTFLAYGKKTKKYDLVLPQLLKDKHALDKEMLKISLPKDFKIILTGTGRVANGVIEMLEILGIKKISKVNFLNKQFSEPTYVQLDYLDYNKRIDGAVKSKENFYNFSNEYESILPDYTAVANMLITGHYYAPNNPVLLTKENINNDIFNVEVIGDISCDIDGPIGCTIRPSTIEAPIYGYNPLTKEEDDYTKDDVLAVMAVDNLPCSLPRDASIHFGKVFISKILLDLMNNGPIIYRGMITCKGELTDRFRYLSDYIS